MPLRIGINALYLVPGDVGGTEIYLRSLLDTLASIDNVNEYFVYVNSETGAGLTPLSQNFHSVICPVKARIRTLRIAFEQSGLPFMLARDRIDVVLNPGYTAPLLARCPSVTVFHDLQHKRHPEFFRAVDLPFWNLLLALAAARSSRIIAVSEATAADLAVYLPVTTGKTRVIPHGVDREFFGIGARRSEGNLPQASRPYLLTVSTLHPHKNFERLLEAFRRFREVHPDYRLIVAGLKGFAARRIESLARDLKLGDAVEFTGWISREKLLGLFEGAHAFIAPSLFEGFGLPVLEAMAAGIPTACSAIAAFDSLGGDSVLRFDPLSIPAIVEAMEKIATDPLLRARAALDGPARARGFDWKLTAAMTLEELVSAAGGAAAGQPASSEKYSNDSRAALSHVKSRALSRPADESR
ncbi:MAG TPA: glycosyltransferase family 1 protein [Bryobacteraceae bacterium]|jgi:glycosyltransferase involved in cell wall biosynthesis|nr:glycosyltransferase family 1 protein [Bryobacteraceae bacterium]